MNSKTTSRCIKGIFCVLLLIMTSSAVAHPALKITIIGVKKEALENVNKRLNSLSNQYHTLTLKQVADFYRQAPEEVKKALAPFGYFKPQVRSQLEKYFPTHAKPQKKTRKPFFSFFRKKKKETPAEKKKRLTVPRWHVIFYVNPGPLLKIQHIDLNITGAGAHDPFFQHLQHDFLLKPGQTFLSATYNNAKQSLFELASQRGYFHAKLLKSVVRVNLKTYRADIVLHFKTGPRYHFGQVTFSKAPFDEAFLYRFVPFQPGQPYTSKLLHQFENALRDSHYFQQALVDLQREKTRDLTIPIHVTLVPVKAKRYTLGIGYSTDIGVHGFASAELRRLTRTGHHLAAYIKPSFFETKGRIEYIIPGENPTTDSYKLSAAILKEFQTRPSTSRSSRRKNPVGEEQGQNVSYSYTTTLNGWQKTLALTFLDARFHNTGQALRNAHFLFPSLLVLKLKSDDILHPTQGYRISILLRGASNDIASTHSFLQARLDAKLLKKLTEYHRVILRGSVGYTDINDIFNLPISLQFLEGGATSVRGYAFQSIGPGKALLVGSAEFQQKVIDNWYAVVYFDAGQVSPRLTGRFNRSVGVGAVWLSPIGAVGLSLARKINHPDKSLHIVLSIGPQL